LYDGFCHEFNIALKWIKIIDSDFRSPRKGYVTFDKPTINGMI